MIDDTRLLNPERVSAYLSRHITGFQGPLSATKFSVGQSNPTFQLKSPSGDYVLRRKPPGKLLKSAHAIDREFRVQKALLDTEVPVPQVHHYCDDPTIIGSEFYIMEMVRGRHLPLPTLDHQSPEERHAIMDEMNRVLAALHDVDIEAVGLSDYGPPGNYYERQISRWTRQYKSSETKSIPDMDSLMAALAKSIPPDDGQRTLVHGDYRIDNMIFERNGTACLALLDWELSTIGHPFADIAAVIMQWQFPPDAQGRGLEGIDRAAQGLPTDQEFVAAYRQRRGIERIPNFGFYLAFCFFRLAAILQGVYKRTLDGNASNPEAGRQFAALIPSFAERGLAALDNRGDW